MPVDTMADSPITDDEQASSAAWLELSKKRIKPHQLNMMELYWMKLQKWLQEEKGYMLRPRFREDWVASWLGTGRDHEYIEDGQVHFVRSSAIINVKCVAFMLTSSQSFSLMDATRMSDGAQVQLKAVSRVYCGFEVDVAQYLSSEALASDPRNHCVPIYESFPVPRELELRIPNEDGTDIIVMPRLKEFDEPHFDTIGEAVDFFAQIFEVSLASLYLEEHYSMKHTPGHAVSTFAQCSPSVRDTSSPLICVDV